LPTLVTLPVGLRLRLLVTVGSPVTVGWLDGWRYVPGYVLTVGLFGWLTLLRICCYGYTVIWLPGCPFAVEKKKRLRLLRSRLVTFVFCCVYVTVAPFGYGWLLLRCYGWLLLVTRLPGLVTVTVWVGYVWLLLLLVDFGLLRWLLTVVTVGFDVTVTHGWLRLLVTRLFGCYGYGCYTVVYTRFTLYVYATVDLRKGRYLPALRWVTLLVGWVYGWLVTVGWLLVGWLVVGCRLLRLKKKKSWLVVIYVVGWLRWQATLVVVGWLVGC